MVRERRQVRSGPQGRSGAWPSLARLPGGHFPFVARERVVVKIEHAVRAATLAAVGGKRPVRRVGARIGGKLTHRATARKSWALPA